MLSIFRLVTCAILSLISLGLGAPINAASGPSELIHNGVLVEISAELVTLYPKRTLTTMLRSIQSKSSDYDMSYASKYVPIAPTPDRRHLSVSDRDGSERRYNYKCSPYSSPQTASIAKRNARERNRVKQVNDGFNALRKRLPAAIVNALSGGARRGSGKKLSKVDTLRMVAEYIKRLQNLLEESDAALGLTSKNLVNTNTAMDTTPYDVDEGIGGRNSPYSDSVPSPVNSDCSSGVSSSYSVNNDYYSYSYQTNEEIVNPVNDNDLLDAISWWQQK